MTAPFTVFTAVLGDTDPLRRPLIVVPDVRYVCFSDRAVHVPPYETIRIVPAEGPRLTSRRLKILADHPALESPEFSLWHDAAFTLTSNPRGLVTLMDGADLLALQHPHRSTIAEEAEAIATLGYVDRTLLDRQVAAYTALGFTQRAITSTGLCLRRHTMPIANFNRIWWAEVRKWHWRDQMSVDFARWLTATKVRYLTGHYRDNPYARWTLYQPAREAACRA